MNLAQLDRTIFELLRLRLVAENLLPDYPPLVGGKMDGATWQARLAAHQGTLVEIFGAGVPTNRGNKTGHRIVINRKAVMRGQLGGGTPYFVTTSGSGPTALFDKKRRAMSTHNVPYEVRTVSGDVEVDRKLTAIVMDVLGTQEYLSIYADGPNNDREFTDEKLLLLWNGSTDIKATELLEQLHNYMFEGVWVMADRTEKAGIKPIIKITSKIKDLNDLGTEDPPTDAEVIIE